jgi:hypothetical protein
VPVRGREEVQEVLRGELLRRWGCGGSGVLCRGDTLSSKDSCVGMAAGAKARERHGRGRWGDRG